MKFLQFLSTVGLAAAMALPPTPAGHSHASARREAAKRSGGGVELYIANPDSADEGEIEKRSGGGVELYIANPDSADEGEVEKRSGGGVELYIANPDSAEDEETA